MAKRPKTPAPPPASIRPSVENWENISRFLRALAQDVANVPNLSSEIVRGSLVVASFLEDRARAARQQFPKEFEDKGGSPDETLKSPKKEPKKREAVAARRRT